VSNRQLRLSDSQQIKSRIESFLDKNISIVRQDNMVFYGLLKKVTPREITLATMRLKDITIDLDHISELYIDTQA
jgi:hypothetical protein